MQGYFKAVNILNVFDGEFRSGLVEIGKPNGIILMDN